MAGKSGPNFDSPSYLTPGQEDLLTAALVSNNVKAKSSAAVGSQSAQQFPNLDWASETGFGFNAMDPMTNTLSSGNQDLSLSSLDNYTGTLEDSGFLDFLETNPNIEDDDALDFNLQNGSDDVLDDGDDDSPDGEVESHEKRKNPEDGDDAEENEPKRRENGEKVPKKPGRKPLTTEPTNKRKAQNRAAQRAFRERKEKHLKDLETKVAELEKNSESKDSENTLLRAQVTRLQTELREYRKRLSLNGSTLGRSPPLSSGLSSYLAGNGSNNNFSFDFPRFGGASNGGFGSVSSNENPMASPISIGSVAMTPPAPRQNSNGNNSDSRNPSRANSAISSTNSPMPQIGSGVQIESINNDNLNGLFGNNATSRRSASMDTVAPHTRIFQFNSNANSTSSPSASSNSQYGGNSSCGTSPEPVQNSPAMGNKDNTLNTISEVDTGGNTQATSNGNLQTNGQANLGNVANTGEVKSFDWFAAQNGGQFDPTLFGDYRESQVAIVGDGEFTGGFFNEAMSVPDFSSPFSWDTFPNLSTGLTPAVSKPNPLEQADMLQAGIEPEEIMPKPQSNSMLDCNKIWDKLQGNKDFNEGNFDIDNLCSELRAKAKCSEGGVVIDQKDVDAALKRMPAKQVGKK